MAPKGSTTVPKPTPNMPNSPAALQQQANSIGIGEYELPKASLVKLAKGSIPDHVKMQQDVVLALMRGSTVFISYLTAAAHDQAISRAGKSITASDVIKAITDLDFGPSDALVPILEHELAAYRANMQAIKLSKAKPPGPGRGRGIRKSHNANTDDVDMTGPDGEDDGEGGEEDENGQEDEGHGSEEDRDGGGVEEGNDEGGGQDNV